MGTIMSSLSGAGVLLCELGEGVSGISGAAAAAVCERV